jgi:polar amino acid transport system substrate-binding protein
LIAAGLSIRPDRALHVNFSQPYAESGLALAAQKKSTADVKSLADLDDGRYTIAAIGGSVAAEFLGQFLPHAKLQAFENADAASAGSARGQGRRLSRGRARAYVSSRSRTRTRSTCRSISRCS